VGTAALGAQKSMGEMLLLAIIPKNLQRAAWDMAGNGVDL
jgi:hypothetical protein